MAGGTAALAPSTGARTPLACGLSQSQAPRGHVSPAQKHGRVSPGMEPCLRSGTTQTRARQGPAGQKGQPEQSPARSVPAARAPRGRWWCRRGWRGGLGGGSASPLHSFLALPQGAELWAHTPRLAGNRTPLKSQAPALGCPAVPGNRKVPEQTGRPGLPQGAGEDHDRRPSQPTASARCPPGSCFA